MIVVNAERTVSPCEGQPVVFTESSGTLQLPAFQSSRKYVPDWPSDNYQWQSKKCQWKITAPSDKVGHIMSQCKPLLFST